MGEMIQGQLGARHVADLFLEIARKELDGVLRLDHNGVTNSVFFEAGAPIFAKSTELIESADPSPEGSGDSGSLAAQIILSTFGWESGDFVFDPDAFEPRPIDMRLEWTSIDCIVEGVRDAAKSVAFLDANVPTGIFLTASQHHPSSISSRATLNPVEGFIFSAVSSGADIEEIYSITGLPEEETRRALCVLLAIGLLEPAADENHQSSAVAHSQSAKKEPLLLGDGSAQSGPPVSDHSFDDADASETASEPDYACDEPLREEVHGTEGYSSGFPSAVARDESPAAYDHQDEETEVTSLDADAAEDLAAQDAAPILDVRANESAPTDRPISRAVVYERGQYISDTLEQPVEDASSSFAIADEGAQTAAASPDEPVVKPSPDSEPQEESPVAAAERESITDDAAGIPSSIEAVQEDVSVSDSPSAAADSQQPSLESGAAADNTDDAGDATPQPKSATGAKWEIDPVRVTGPAEHSDHRWIQHGRVEDWDPRSWDRPDESQVTAAEPELDGHIIFEPHSGGSDSESDNEYSPVESREAATIPDETDSSVLADREGNDARHTEAARADEIAQEGLGEAPTMAAEFAESAETEEPADSAEDSAQPSPADRLYFEEAAEPEPGATGSNFDQPAEQSASDFEFAETPVAVTEDADTEAAECEATQTWAADTDSIDASHEAQPQSAQEDTEQSAHPESLAAEEALQTTEPAADAPETTAFIPSLTESADRENETAPLLAEDDFGPDPVQPHELESPPILHATEPVAETEPAADVNYAELIGPVLAAQQKERILLGSEPDDPSHFVSDASEDTESSETEFSADDDAAPFEPASSSVDQTDLAGSDGSQTEEISASESDYPATPASKRPGGKRSRGKSHRHNKHEQDAPAIEEISEEQFEPLPSFAEPQAEAFEADSYSSDDGDRYDDDDDDAELLILALQDLDDKLDALRNADYYQTLGVARLAAKDRISRAYASRKDALVDYRGRWTENKEVQQKIESLLYKYSEAFATLGDLERRRLYDQQVRSVTPRTNTGQLPNIEKRTTGPLNTTPIVKEIPTLKTDPPSGAAAESSASQAGPGKTQRQTASGSRNAGPDPKGSRTGSRPSGPDPAGVLGLPDLGVQGNMSMEEIAAIRFQQGLQLFKKKDVYTALHLLREAVRLDARKSEHHYYLGLTLSILSRARKEHKHDAGCHVTCQIEGKLPSNQRIRHEAVQHLTRASELDPNNVKILADLAALYKDAGMPKKAEYYMDKAMLLDGKGETASASPGVVRGESPAPSVNRSKKSRKNQTGPLGLY